MDINDFQGIAYFRFLVPSIYVIVWTAMVIGPQTASTLYRQYAMALTIFITGKAFYQVVLNFILVIKGNAVIKRASNTQKKAINAFNQYHNEIYHAFTIPSYNEDIEIMIQTLQVLSEHTRATSSYLIFLAMEEHQKKSDKKALQLINQFRHKFRYIDFTVHKLRPNEQKGKASNVSWCVQHMEDKLTQLMINSDDVFVTVVDADSWAPNCYFNQLQDHLFSNFESRYNFIYQPTQIYTRNNMDVPIIVRTYDDMYSSLHASNQVSCSGITFSFSNYTLSFSLVKKIGFWDTVEQAIAQDFHMCLKAHFKTNGQVKLVPIFAPFNQLSIQTCQGYKADMKAKFWQIQRHARVVSDIGYCILMLFKTKFSFKSLCLVLSVIEMILLPIIMPWILISLIFFDEVLHVDAPTGFLNPKYCMIMWNISSFSMLISCILFENYKRSCSKALYGIENPHIIRCLEAPIFSTINILIYMTPTYILAAFGNLKKNRKYEVAAKNVANKLQASQIVQNLEITVQDEIKELLDN